MILPANSASRPARYDSLDLWRGVACLMVVILHAGHYANEHADLATQDTDPVGVRLVSVIGRLGIGVQLFFVVSGYCIAATVANARQKQSAGMQFFARRFRRIFPPYWAALAAMAGLVALQPALGIGQELTTAADGGFPPIPSPAELTTSQWVGNLTLTEHWRWHLFGAPESKLHGPAWTLCYEEQFYAVCGFLLVTVRRRFFAGVAVVTAATLALVLGAHAADSPVPSGFFFDGRWLLFATGVAVHAHLTSPPYGRRWLIPLLLATGLITGAWFRYAHLRASPDTALRQMAFEWIVGFGFALVLIFLHRWDRQLTAVPVLRPLAFCGRMCYSLYLIHWPVTLVVGVWLHHNEVRGIWPTLLLTIPLATVLSVLASWSFFRLVEQRFLNPLHAPHAASASVEVPDSPLTAAEVDFDHTQPERRVDSQMTDEHPRTVPLTTRTL